MPTRTVLYGASGAGNLGDDAILQGALKVYSGREVVVVGYGKPQIRGFKPQAIFQPDFIAAPERFLVPGDELVFAGGGLFWADQHIQEMLRAATYVKGAGGAVRMERIGVHGFNFDVESSKKLFAIADFISVRDTNGVDMTYRYGLSDRAVFERDFAFENEGSLPPRTTNAYPLPRIGINHGPHLFLVDAEHRKRTLEIYTAAAIRNPDIEFVYVPHVRHYIELKQNDVIAGEYFYNHSRGRIKVTGFPATVDDLLEIYSSLSGSLGWRYHLMVLSTINRIPTAFLGIPDEHKYFAFADQYSAPKINFRDSLETIATAIDQFVATVRRRAGASAGGSGAPPVAAAG